MSNVVLFPVIDLSATGRSIERCRKEAGLSVRDVQNYFGFEYPQAVYKWQHGECLPSVDNLLALARLLRVRMEDLLVYEDQEVPLFYQQVFHTLFFSIKTASVTSGSLLNRLCSSYLCIDEPSENTSDAQARMSA